MVKNFRIQDRLNSTVRPQDDFFSYVNKKWLEANPVPETESRWGSFNVLREEVTSHMHTIYQDLQDTPQTEGSVEQQARDFYFTATHFTELKDANLKVLDRYFTQIDQITNLTELSHLLGTLSGGIGPSIWRVIVDVDNKDSKQHVLRLQQGGLTLPSRDYYLEETKKMVDVRNAYKKYCQKVISFLPQLAADFNQLWSTVYSLEFDLANHSRSSVELRDINRNYNPTSLSKLTQRYQQIDWSVYAKALGWDMQGSLTVDQPEFMKFVNLQLQTRSLDEWKLYLKWRLATCYLGYISEEAAEIQFDFFGKILSGKQEMQPTWKRAVTTIDACMGDNVGKLYAKNHFSPEAKKQVLAIVEEVREAYAARINRLDWMSDATKTYAQQKLHNMSVLIGYPDEWRDFSKLTIDRTSYLENIISTLIFESQSKLQKLLKPTSRNEWFMSPQTVNAYHDPNRLVICFPAAILQAPFFDPKAPLAVNMGGIGTVIGHELTHGFDDQGCQFDAEGNVRDWQTTEERIAFTKKARMIIEQADAWQVLPDLKMKGDLVIGEAIADLGGLEIALEALKTHIPDVTQPVLGSFTHQQLFFIGYATTECGASRPEMTRMVTLTDPHPHETFRVNGMLKNIDDFYTTYGLTSSDELYLPKSDRAFIW